MGQVLIIVARIKAKKNNATLVETELLKLVEPTRKEEGCLQYDLHQDNEKPEIFIFYENWASNDLLQAHMNSEHLKALLKAIDGAVNELTVNVMSKIDVA